MAAGSVVFFQLPSGLLALAGYLAIPGRLSGIRFQGKLKIFILPGAWQAGAMPLIIRLWALQMSWYPYFCFIRLLFMFYCSPHLPERKCSRNNGCVRSSEISNRNIEKNSNSREIVFRYNKENILKSIILKYVIIKGDIPDPGCIFLLSKLYVRRNRIKFILDILHLINRKFILLIIWK